MYRPKFVTQHDGSVHAKSNCTMASAAMGLDFHTLGKVKKTGAEMRKAQSDQVGGTDLGDAIQAWKHFGYTLTDRRGKTWNELLADLKAGRGAVVQGDADQIPGSAFAGDHSIYINPEFFENGTKVAMGDPNSSGYRRIALSDLRKYAEKFGRKVYGDNRILYGVTRSQAVVTPPPAPVDPHLAEIAKLKTDLAAANLKVTNLTTERTALVNRIAAIKKAVADG